MASAATTPIHGTRAPFAALLLGLGVAAFGAMQGMNVGIERLNAKWLDPYSYSHGYLILCMSAWLLHAAVKRAGPVRVAPSPVGLAGLALLVAVYAVMLSIDFTLGMQLLIPPLALVATLAIGGAHLTRLALVPIALLYFAIPVWDLAIRPLQILATAVVSWALSISPIPVVVDGNTISIPTGSFVVTDSCAGQRFLVSGLALASFYAIAWIQRPAFRFAIVAAAAAASIVSNWIRILALVVVGHVTEMQHFLIIEDHYAFGWAIFMVAMIPVVWLARRLESQELADAPTPAGASTPAAGPPVSASPILVLVAGLVSGAILASPSLIERHPETRPDTLAVAIAPADLPTGWRATRSGTEWVPRYQQPHYEMRAAYVAPDLQPVDVYAVRYLYSSAPSKLVSPRNRLQKGWNLIARRELLVALPGGELTVAELQIERRGEQRLVWYWYRLGDLVTPSPGVAKLAEILNLARGRRDGALVAVSSRCGIDCGSARATASRFIGDFAPTFERFADGAWDTAPR